MIRTALSGIANKIKALPGFARTNIYVLYGQSKQAGTSAPCSMDGGWTRDTFSLYSHP